MQRLKADVLILFAAFIWGTAFVAQKTGMDGLGPFGFVGVRFCISLAFVLPLAFHSYKKRPVEIRSLFKTDFNLLLATGCALFSGMALQQVGLLTSTVTNAGFLTGLYVVFVPLMAWLCFKTHVRPTLWVACGLAITGIWCLSGGTFSALVVGDWLMFFSALCFSLYIVLLGRIMLRGHSVMVVASFKYLLLAVFGLTCAFTFEGLGLQMVYDNLGQLLYTGVVSGGIAFTIAIAAQKKTPASEAAVLYSTETLFAALAGAVLLGDTLPALGWLGCGLIICAMLMVEAFPALYCKYRGVKVG
ncbi:MAG: DMT family transporter [Alphaproteobacteria bacterium]|nr:DMT family transporter [Alphaproteobacteria bacterium]